MSGVFYFWLYMQIINRNIKRKTFYKIDRHVNVTTNRIVNRCSIWYSCISDQNPEGLDERGSILLSGFMDFDVTKVNNRNI